VQATIPGQTTPASVGQLELTRFPNEGGLSAVGDNLFTETPSSGAPQSGVPGSVGYGTIQQGFLEGANVNAVEEMTSLITAQRAYEMNSKVITAADQMLQETSQLGGS
jgi:flagellar basal-body rod protein FlgG